MSRTMTVSDSAVVAADPMTLWTAIADPTQMPRWSPENTGAVLTTEPHTLQVGETFVGSNRRPWVVLALNWRTRSRVTVSEPGVCFEFHVDRFGVFRPRLPVSIATWRYTFDAVPEGTLVTETWTDGRAKWPDFAARVFDFVAVSGSTFARFQRGNIARTLAALQADFARTPA